MSGSSSGARAAQPRAPHSSMTISNAEGAATWLESNTWERPGFSVEELVEAKAGRTISVVLPALNEERTVGSVVEAIMPLVGGLVDELVVVDSGSIDATIEVARAAGARVQTRESALEGIPVVDGKGEVLWRSLATTGGDIVAFIDSDLVDPDPTYVPKLVGPLLIEPDLHLVKGYYRRPLMGVDGVDPSGGGRVTELTVRPLLAALCPDLCGLIQPLAGEYAGTRELLTSIPFAPGYGVEIGISSTPSRSTESTRSVRSISACGYTGTVRSTNWGRCRGRSWRRSCHEWGSLTAEVRWSPSRWNPMARTAHAGRIRSSTTGRPFRVCSPIFIAAELAVHLRVIV